MLINNEYIQVRLFGIILKIKRLSYTQFKSIAYLLRKPSPLQLYRMIIEGDYSQAKRFIDPSGEWLIRAVQEEYKYLGLFLSYFVAIFIIKYSKSELFINKLFNEGALLYLDAQLGSHYAFFFNEQEAEPISKTIVKNLKTEGILEVLLFNGGINMKDISYIEHVKYTYPCVIKTIQAMNGLSTEPEEMGYEFKCEEYIDGAFNAMRAFKIKNLCRENMFSDEMEQAFKWMIGSSVWGSAISKYSRQYLFCKYGDNNLQK